MSGPLVVTDGCPKENARLYVPVELSGSIGRVVLEAAHRDLQATIFWDLDDTYRGHTRDIHQMPLAPPQGRQVLTLVGVHCRAVSEVVDDGRVDVGEVEGRIRSAAGNLTRTRQVSAPEGSSGRPSVPQ